MKELQLPKAIPIRFYLDGDKPKSPAQSKVFSAETALIEKNGSEIISAAIMMEDRMIEAVGKILFGVSTESSKNHEFFVNEIMETSDFSYAFKRRVFTRLFEQFEILDPKKNQETESRTE